jgi:ParB family chromosome partitioning protein
LLGIEGERQSDTAKIVAGKGLTVRETEALIRKLLEPAAEKKPKEPDPDVKRLENLVSESLGASVDINYNSKGKGKMVIHFSSLDELEGILGQIDRQD